MFYDRTKLYFLLKKEVTLYSGDEKNLISFNEMSKTSTIWYNFITK